MPVLTTGQLAAILHTAASYLETFGIWRGDSFTDPFGVAQDIPSAIYRAANGGRLTYDFSLPGAVNACKATITAHPAAMTTIRALAAYVDSHNDAPASPEARAAVHQDPIDFLAYWPERLGVESADVIDTMHDFALHLHDTAAGISAVAA